MRAQPKASHFIDGHYVEDASGDLIQSINPATGDVIAEVRAATPDVIAHAIESARRAQTEWRLTSGADRAAILARTADLVEARNEELSELETLDTGKPIQETLVADAMSAVENLRYFSGLCHDLTGETRQLGAEANGSFVYTLREPVGVCAGIGAWNYPIQIAAWKSAPALAAGNGFVFKPSETTPLTALKLAEIYVEAGLPAGLFNVIQGAGPVGAALAEHPGINKVSLTGSTGSGAKAMGSASKNVTPVTLELGGKSPLIIFDDADLENAVSGAMLGNFYSSGQICSNGTRVFVQAGIYDAFVARLVERTEKLVLGDPLNETTHIGPLVSAAQLERVLGFIDAGKSEGARLVSGGAVADVQNFPAGYFVQPTIFADVEDEMTIAREEIFGPVLSVLRFGEDEEAVARANSSETGLAAGVFTQNLARAHRTIAELEAGTCWINNYNLTPAGMPFGGVKQSGFGRENAKAALDSVTHIKSVYVELGDVDSPY
ncbi:MAG: betaine-aldehyde dehydrogenase [Pseudomonadota bacterium]